MKPIVRLVLAGVAVLAAAPLVFSIPVTGDAKILKAIKPPIEKTADAIAAGKKSADVDKLVKATVAKVYKVDDKEYAWLNVMSTFRPKDKGGYEIERKIQSLTRNKLGAAVLKKESAALIQLGYRTSALAKITHAMPMEKDKKKRPAKAKWLNYAKDMDKAAMNFVQAVKSKSPAAVQKAAAALDKNCNQCHTDFRP